MGQQGNVGQVGWMAARRLRLPGRLFLCPDEMDCHHPGHEYSPLGSWALTTIGEYLGKMVSHMVSTWEGPVTCKGESLPGPDPDFTDHGAIWW